ncbi:MAG: hypothetical protein MJ252_07130 [archaeon]|nr:hypothetical protein [archaeon]
MLNLDGEEIDCKCLLQFDLLQRVLIRLAKRCEDAENQIQIFNDQIASKDKKISDLESKFKVLSNTTDQRIKNLEIALKNNIVPNKSQFNSPGKNSKFSQISPIQTNKEANTFVDKDDAEGKLISQIGENTVENKKEISAFNQGKTIQEGEGDFKNKEINEGPETKEFQINQVITTNEVRNQFVQKEGQLPELNCSEILGDLLSDGEENKNMDKQLQEAANAENPQISPELVKILFKKLEKIQKDLDTIKKKTLKKYLEEANKQRSAINQLENDLSNKDGEMAEIKEYLTKTKEDNEKIMLKMQEFNIYDLFKDSGTGTTDAAKMLCLTLENKVFKKFGFVEDRIKKCEENDVKFSNSIPILESEIKTSQMKINQINEANTKHEEDSEEKMKKIKENISEVEERLKDLLNKAKEETENKSKELKENLTNLLINEMSELSNKIDEQQIANVQNANPELSKDDVKVIQIFTKRVNELDKQIKVKLNLIDMDLVHQKIAKVENMVTERMDQSDLNRLLDKFKGLEEADKDMLYKVSVLTDESNQTIKEVASIKTNLENLWAKVASGGQASGDTGGSNSRKFIDVTKFIDLIKFEENNKVIFSKIDKLRRECEDLQRQTEELGNNFGNYPTKDSFNDYKNNMDNYLLEINKENIRKFADKITTEKALKLMEVNIKDGSNKSAFADNCMLAKKPMSGYQCACCDSYINEIDKKYDYVPWNKYPLRDEKSYRMGHGFSRMLQMVNMDILKSAEAKKEGENSDSGDEAVDRRPKSGVAKKKNLPKLPKKKKKNVITIDRLSDDEKGEENKVKEEGVVTPKVVKIYKKIKAVNMSTNAGNESS